MTFDLLNAEDFPFLDFAEDEDAYERSRRFWFSAFLETMGSERKRWYPWMSDPFRDGHPIFSVIDPAEGRAVLLQQVLKEEDPVWFKCWMSTSADPAGRRIDVLFIESFVSLQSRELFDEVTSAWCRERVSVDDMAWLTDAVRRRAADHFDTIDFGWPSPDGPSPHR